LMTETDEARGGGTRAKQSRRRDRGRRRWARPARCRRRRRGLIIGGGAAARRRWKDPPTSALDRNVNRPLRSQRRLRQRRRVVGPRRRHRHPAPPARSAARCPLIRKRRATSSIPRRFAAASRGTAVATITTRILSSRNARTASGSGRIGSATASVGEPRPARTSSPASPSGTSQRSKVTAFARAHSISARFPRATERPPTIPQTPLPGNARKSRTSASATPDAPCRMAAARGCSLPRSSDAASRRVSASEAPGAMTARAVACPP
jgi:hypothetical protein